MNKTTVWKIVEKSQETIFTPERSRCGPKMKCADPSSYKIYQRKDTAKYMSPRQKTGCHNKNTLNIDESSGEGGYQDSSLLCGQPSVLTQVYKAMRLRISRLILHQIAKDTLHSLVFADEKKLDIKQTMNNQNGQFWSVSGSVRVDS